MIFKDVRVLSVVADFHPENEAWLVFPDTAYEHYRNYMALVKYSFL